MSTRFLSTFKTTFPNEYTSKDCSIGIDETTGYLHYSAMGTERILLTSVGGPTAGVAAEFAAGSNAAPTVILNADADTGIYQIAANNLGVACAGAKVLDIGITGLGVVGVLKSGDGNAGGPGLSFTSDANSGIYSIGADNIGVSCAGTKVLDIATTGLGVVGILKTGDGAVTGPSFSFTSDANTGIYVIGADNIGVACASAKVLDISANGLGVVGVVLSGNGTVSLPAFAFTSDPNTGVYRIGADRIGIAVGGVVAVDIGAATCIFNQLTITRPTTSATLTIPDGASLITVGAYAVTLTASNTTGVTLPTTGTLATLAGAESLSNKSLIAPVGATSTGVMITKRVIFSETLGSAQTIFTGTVAIPAGAWVHDICVTNTALWTAAAAVLKVGDTAVTDGYFIGVDCKTSDLAVGEVLSIRGGSIDTDGLWGGKQGAYLVAATGRIGPVATNFGLYYAAGSNILGTMTLTTPGGGRTGLTVMSVTYSVGEALAAVMS